MTRVEMTATYARWFDQLRDRAAQYRINQRIRRLLLGNEGDVRPVGRGVSELRVNYGPGYRVYYMRRGRAVIILLAGGDKDSQNRDIPRAIELAQHYRN